MLTLILDTASPQPFTPFRLQHSLALAQLVSCHAPLFSFTHLAVMNIRALHAGNYRLKYHVEIKWLNLSTLLLSSLHNDCYIEHLADEYKASGPRYSESNSSMVWHTTSLPLPHIRLSNDELALGSDSSRQDRGWFVKGDASLRQA